MVVDGWCPTQQMLGVFLRRILVKKLLLTGTAVLLMATSANAGPEAEHRGHWVSPRQWQMNDIGRNHGVLGGLVSQSAILGYLQSALVCIPDCLRKFRDHHETQPPLTATTSETQTRGRGFFYRGAVPGNNSERTTSLCDRLCNQAPHTQRYRRLLVRIAGLRIGRITRTSKISVYLHETL